MARYSALLGQRIEVHYHAGDILLPATGTLVADSGRSIFLEEHFCQHGRVKNFRWEIPYQCITRLAESPALPPASDSPGASSPEAVAAEAGIVPRLKNRPEEA